MITKETVASFIAPLLEDSDLFIVDIQVNPGNAIEVLVDKDSGLTIDDCKKVSRAVEGSLDREVEDFSLEVSSPGVGKPLLVKRQYFKNVGRNVAIKTIDGKKIEGQMTLANEEHIQVDFREKEIVPGKKSKQWVEKQVVLPYAEIKETKITISFK
ncbi:MAG: ribosome assembly cofactor RimP [Bacteroidetes bacterium]|nr:ribosome assembly cofactor RimP [Bacteroidota bacterium]